MSRITDTRAAPARVLRLLFGLGVWVLAFGAPCAFADDSGPADGCAKGSEQESFCQRLADSYKTHLFPGEPPPSDPNAPPTAPSGYDHGRGAAPPESVPPWPSGNDNFYPCMNGLNDSNSRWNNVQHAVAIWYHKINDRWRTDTVIWYMWEAHTPNVNNPAGNAAIAAAFPAPEFNVGAPDGAQCVATVVYCYSYEWAAVNYINHQYTA